MSNCPWCRDPNADDVDDDRVLCLMHRAEYNGESIDSMERGEAIEAAEYAEWVLGE